MTDMLTYDPADHVTEYNAKVMTGHVTVLLFPESADHVKAVLTAALEASDHAGTRFPVSVQDTETSLPTILARILDYCDAGYEIAVPFSAPRRIWFDLNQTAETARNAFRCDSDTWESFDAIGRSAWCVATADDDDF